jgi:transcriptional regulator with XRE-family HTH domain
MQQEIAMTLREFLGARGVRMDAAGLLAGLDGSTISKIAAGKVRARPKTVVRLATSLGVSARRMQAMCDASWAAANAEAGSVEEHQSANEDEAVPA